MLKLLSRIALFLVALAITIPVTAQNSPNFGSNVLVFDPSMPTSQIQSAVDTVASQQTSNQFGTQRYALLFKPGVYGSDTPLIIQVGSYTDVIGLGASPSDVVINGHVDVYNQCFSPSNCIALDNFWRSVQNLTIKVKGLSGCRASGDFWAVSQASPMRRVAIQNGNLTLMDYCTAGPQYASGGFIADSQAQFVINGSQQQFLVRNSSLTGWSNGVWNQVFSGVLGAPAQSFSTTPFNPPPYTTLATSPSTREKPFLYLDGEGEYNVFVPDAQTNSSGTTWASGPTPGKSISLKRFFIASPETPVRDINGALSLGQNLILTPGIYNLTEPINVTRPNTIVLGLGLPTLIPQNGNASMVVGDGPGMEISGILFDAGPINSPVLLAVGSLSGRRAGSASNPDTIQDVYFRIGGDQRGKATTSLVVNASHTIVDNVWAWRADHGTGVGWTSNTADHGVIVNGDDVTAYGLFVEHYQNYEVMWNGERGETIFFQNEMPYDPPSQSQWMHDGVNGFAAYKVADWVKTHQAYGLSSYCNFVVDPTIHAYDAFEVPNTPGVQMHDLLTISWAVSGRLITS